MHCISTLAAVKLEVNESRKRERPSCLPRRRNQPQGGQVEKKLDHQLSPTMNQPTSQEEARISSGGVQLSRSE